MDVCETKGKRGRMVPIDPSIRQVIERLPQTKDGLLFHNAEGARLRVDVDGTWRDEMMTENSCV